MTDSPLYCHTLTMRQRMQIARKQTQLRCDEQFIQLLEQHRSQLFGYIFCMLRNLTDAEDVFQQTSITLWDKFSEFIPGSNFMAWAKTVARNKALTFIRARSREQTYFTEQVLDELAERDLWTSESHECRLRALAECQRKLSTKDQSLLGQCYGTEGTIRDVAREIGRPVDSVYSSLSRIRRALYSCIQRALTKESLA